MTQASETPRLSLLVPEPPPPGSPAAEPRFKIGDLARLTGRTVRALRLYEELGLLQPGDRTEGGFRVYSDDAVARVHWIGKLQDLGFTLPAIQELCNVGASAQPGAQAMTRVREVFHEKLREVRAQMERLRELEAELKSSLSYLEDCCGCERGPVNQVCNSCAEPGHDAAHTPSLVGGIRNQRCQP
ncbi:MAG: MerR family transcriptional regulator [Myxococcota bacterium]